MYERMTHQSIAHRPPQPGLGGGFRLRAPAHRAADLSTIHLTPAAAASLRPIVRGDPAAGSVIGDLFSCMGTNSGQLRGDYVFNTQAQRILPKGAGRASDWLAYLTAQPDTDRQQHAARRRCLSPWEAQKTTRPNWASPCNAHGVVSQRVCACAELRHSPRRVFDCADARPRSQKILLARVNESCAQYPLLRPCRPPSPLHLDPWAAPPLPVLASSPHRLTGGWHDADGMPLKASRSVKTPAFIREIEEVHSTLVGAVQRPLCPSGMTTRVMSLLSPPKQW